MINGLRCSGRSVAFRIIAVRLCLPRRFLLPHIFFTDLPNIPDANFGHDTFAAFLKISNVFDLTQS